MDIRYARVKGGYTLHRKLAGEWNALCGHHPGEAKSARVMKDRTGWATFLPDYVPHSLLKVCPKCLEQEKELLAKPTL